MTIRRALIALGSNLNQPQKQLQAACVAITLLPHVRLLAKSPMYRTAPVDCAVGSPDFINAAVCVETALPAPVLLGMLQGIEAAFGRVRPHVNAPRVLDLDLIAVEGETTTDPYCTLPHPRASGRGFVMKPLADIVPEWIVDGRSVGDWCAATDLTDIVRLPETDAEVW